MSELIGETLRLLRLNAWRIAAALTLLTGINLFADLGVDPVNRGGIDLIATLVTLFLQTWLTIALLEAQDQRRGRRGAGTVFLIGLASGLGIVVGLVFLVLPGIFLLVRWSMSVPYALGEDAGVFDSMQTSFEETKDSFWPILVVLLACYAPFLFAVAAMWNAEVQTLVQSVAFNLPINIGLFAGWHAAVAIYLLRRREAGLSELFA